jgi:hypothetical protein
MFLAVRCPRDYFTVPIIHKHLLQLLSLPTSITVGLLYSERYFPSFAYVSFFSPNKTFINRLSSEILEHANYVS